MKLGETALMGLCAALAWTIVCARIAYAGGGTTVMRGESVVLAGEQPTKLFYDSVMPGTMTVRSTFLADAPGCVVYKQGADYSVDYKRGTIRRTRSSRIPDFSKNMLYGRKDFDHNAFPGYGNGAFFAWVDYSPTQCVPLTAPSQQQSRLEQTGRRLRAGGPFKIVAFGDSITAGGEASTLELQFQSQFAAELRRRFPKANIQLENGATGGDTTVQGLARLEEKVLKRSPDLVLLGFGMNDHNRPDVGGVPVEQFQRNLETMVTTIRQRTGADAILFSCFPPNPDWKFGTHQMEKYAEATRRAADNTKSGYADVYCVWAQVLKRKDASSLLGNNINHPNDFGHWLYAQALCALEF